MDLEITSASLVSEFPAPDCEHQWRSDGAWISMHARELPDGRWQMYGIPTYSCAKCWTMKPIPLPATCEPIGEPYVPKPIGYPGFDPQP